MSTDPTETVEAERSRKRAALARAQQAANDIKQAERAAHKLAEVCELTGLRDDTSR